MMIIHILYLLLFFSIFNTMLLVPILPQGKTSGNCHRGRYQATVTREGSRATVHNTGQRELVMKHKMNVLEELETKVYNNNHYNK